MEEIDEIKSKLQLYGISIIKAEYIKPKGYVTGTYKFETADNQMIGIDQLKYWDTKGSIIGDIAEEYFKLERG